MCACCCRYKGPKGAGLVKYGFTGWMARCGASACLPHRAAPLLLDAAARLPGAFSRSSSPRSLWRSLCRSLQHPPSIPLLPPSPLLTTPATHPPHRCYKKCSSFPGGATDTTAPNDPNADSMATILAHEIVEIVSDPNFDAWWVASLGGSRSREKAGSGEGRPHAGHCHPLQPCSGCQGVDWRTTNSPPAFHPPSHLQSRHLCRYDDRGYENADICIWRYSNVQYGRRTDGSQYRFTSLFGGKPFLIQDNYSPDVGGLLGMAPAGAVV